MKKRGWRTLVALAVWAGACSSPPPQLASCEEVADEAARLLIAVVNAGEERGLGEVAEPEAGRPLIDHLAVIIEDTRLRGRAEALREAEAELECGEDGWADERVAAQLARESEERLRRLAADRREPTVGERNALNVLAILQGALTGQGIGVEVDLFD